MEEYKLSDISIGLADGESESHDEKFIDMFYTGNNKCEELRQGNKYIICGRKGTGKTVLAKYYQHEQESKNRLLVSKYDKLRDLSMHELIEFGEKVLNRKTMYNFQKYYIFKEIAYMLKEKQKSLADFGFNLKNYLCYRKRLRKLRNFYDSKYDDDIYEIISLSEIDSNELQSNVSVENKGFSAKNSYSLTRSKKEKEFYKILDTLKKHVCSVLEYINVLLIIDDFDDYFIDDKIEMIRFLIDFSINIKEVNDILYKKSENNRCIILMRDDVIDKFASNDSNSQRSLFDSMVKLNWIEGSNQTELKKMVCNKIIHSNPKLHDLKIKDIEDLFFPKDKQSVSKGKKVYEVTFFKNLFELGFGRPRDIVVLLNLIKNKNPNERKFTFNMIRDATLDYSKHFIGELKNEMYFHYDSEFIDTIFQVLSDQKMHIFGKKDIEDFIISNGNKYSIPVNIEAFINIMYKHGIIGYFKPTGKLGKRGIYTWRYYSNAPEDVDMDSMFSVHKGLRKGLNI